MESKKNIKKRTLNQYRQSKDFGYQNPSSKRNFYESRQHKKFYEDITEAAKKFSNDQELGGFVRRIIMRHRERLES
jgi:hemoglobin-like flavoprotein